MSFELSLSLLKRGDICSDVKGKIEETELDAPR